MQLGEQAKTIGVIGAGVGAYLADFYQLVEVHIATLSGTATLVLSTIMVFKTLIELDISKLKEQSKQDREEVDAYVAEQLEKLRVAQEVHEMEVERSVELARQLIRSPVLPQKED